MLQVHNIDNASPATVSRNGMVFMSSSVLEWHPILSGWLLTRPSQQQDIILQSFEAVFGHLYNYMLQALEPKMDVSYSVCY